MRKMLFRLGILMILASSTAYVMSAVISANSAAGLYAPEDSPIFTDFSWFFIVMMLPVLLQSPMIVFATTRFRTWMISKSCFLLAPLMLLLVLSWISSMWVQIAWTFGSFDRDHWQIFALMSFMLITTSSFIISDIRWILAQRKIYERSKLSKKPQNF